MKTNIEIEDNLKGLVSPLIINIQIRSQSALTDIEKTDIVTLLLSLAKQFQ
jgi:hypothetical protein